MATLPFSFATVTNESELNKDLAAIAGGNGSYTITLGRGFTLNTDLLAVNLGAGGSLTLQGNGQTINGGGTYRGFFDYAGVLILNNLTIADAVATGGRGGTAEPVGFSDGAGGGGAGLGGGLFVASAGNVTLNNVTFTNDKAVGGSGGDETGSPTTAAGGGGGLGGNGGAASTASQRGAINGSGGGIGLSATGGSGSPGGSGIIPTGPATRIGGGGGTGSDTNYVPGSGGVQPGSFGGGGAFRVSHGGFGGGGGGSGNGGFGGGGGGRGLGGFGGGKGGIQHNFEAGAGGGGLGAGADVFVQQGGRLTIGAASLGVGTVVGGKGGNGGGPGTAGSAFGNGIFIQGNQSITFAPPSGETTTVSSIIADQNPSIANSGGAGGVVLNGAGTLDLAVAEPYTGGTTIKGGGTLELAVPSAAGSGNIAFNGNGELLIDTLATPTNKITGFGTNNGIDLAALPFVAGATAVIKNNKLEVTSGGKTITLNVESKDATLFAQKDASGGTFVSRFAPVVTNEVQLNTELTLLAGSTTAEKITIGASFALTTPLQVINLGAGGALTIDGGGFLLNGQGAQRGLLVYSGIVTINNLALNNMAAIGGAGGSAANPGGGGAGLGGGLLVAAGGDVTLNNVSFAGDSTQGGAGGSYYNGGFAGGGGGGLGGAGGNGFVGGSLDFTTDGGGGGLGLGATGGMQDVNNGEGYAGVAPGAASGGKGGQGTSGGVNGGGGGDAARGDGGGGGIGGQQGNSAGNFGGNGGFGGGGGGGGSGFFDKTQGGGSGGFGGGAGGGANSSHTGGFGGGGGGAGDNPGVPGFGGGLGGGSNFGGGGGGGALGADVLVQQGGRLTIGSGTLAAGTDTGGAGGKGRTPNNGGNPGGSGGSGIFLQGNQTVTFAPASGTTLDIKGVVADESAFNPGAGAGRVEVNGRGTVKLAAGNSYTGGTVFQSGTLELVLNGSGGAGAITFGASGAPVETLRLDYVKPEAATVSQTIQSLGSGSSLIYLPDVSSTNIVFGSYVDNRLTFKTGNTSYTLSKLTVAAGDTINASSIVADKSGTGIDISATRQTVNSSSAGAAANVTRETISLGAGTQTMSFLPPNSTVLGGSGTDTVTAEDGTNQFVAGAGSLTVTGGSAASDFILHAGSGEMIIQDFNFAKGDALTVDKALQASFTQASDNHGGTMLSFGAGQGSIDLVNHAAISASSVHFV